MNQNRPPMPPVPCPRDRAEPPDASVKYSKVHAGNRVGDGMAVRPEVLLSMTHQKCACRRIAAVMRTVAFLSLENELAAISSSMLNLPDGIKGA
jgi:hypothetical protein